MAQEPAAASYPPLQAWKVWLLHMATFSLYAPFWMRRSARDLSLLDGKPRRLWLWFLSPLFAFALPSAMTNLGRGYADLAGSALAKPQRGGVWGVLAFIFSAAMSVTDRIETPWWIVLLLLMALSGCFAAMQSYINAAKLALPAVPAYRSLPWQYTNLQRACVLGCGLLTLTITGLVLYQEHVTGRGSPLANGQSYLDESRRFRVTAVGDEWLMPPIGTQSDGTAEFELQGPLLDMYAVVFTYGPQDSLDDLAHDRTMTLEAGNASIQCTEQRSLQQGTLLLVSDIRCTGTAFGEQTLDVVRIVAGDGHIIEILGHLATARGSFPSASSMLTQTVATFGVP